MTYMPPFPPEHSAATANRDDHGWVVAHMINLIAYCESEGLAEAERTLTEATERLAPLLNGHRLAHLRARNPDPAPGELPTRVAHVLEMPVTGAQPRHAPA